MENLSKILKEEARYIGLCEKWEKKWKEDITIQELVDNYLLGIEFCLKYDFPSIETLKSHIDIVNEKNIYCDQSFDVENQKLVVLLGKSKGKITMNNAIGEIYACHESELEVCATGGSKVWINALDFSKIKIETDGNSVVYLHNYGDCCIESSGNIQRTDKKNFYRESKKR